MIPGPKVFRSRWSALFWAAGVIWFAIDIAGQEPHERGTHRVAIADADGEAVNAADLAAVANIAGL